MANKTANAKPAKADKPGFGAKLVHGCKDMVRKFIVMLKRRPSHIPFAVFIVAFIIYSFHLADVSNTTALLGGTNMGLAAFVIMLLSMLSLLCFMNAFPYRKKVNVPMLVIMLVMVAIIAYCDVFYIQKIADMVAASNGSVDPSSPDRFFITLANYYLTMHIILLAVGVVLTALLPVYSKLIRKIKTNIDVEGNGEMGAIDLASD